LSYHEIRKNNIGLEITSAAWNFRGSLERVTAMQLFDKFGTIYSLPSPAPTDSAQEIYSGIKKAALAKISQATIEIEKADSLKPLQTKEFDVQMSTYDVQEQQQQQVDPRTAKWLDENPWYGDDDEMSASALGLHKKLEKQFGKQYIGSEEYFKNIDDTMKRRFPEYFGSAVEEDNSEEEEKPQARAKPASNVVAPATRSTAPSKVKLTKSQVAIAKKLGVPLELYAKKVAEQMKGNQ
jgi:hypothetical protein